MLKRVLIRWSFVFVACMAVLSGCGSQPLAPEPTNPPPAPTAQPTLTPTPVPPATPTLVPVAPTATATPPLVADPITGAPGLARGSVAKRLYAVMIDNHPNAYPQSGIDHAVVVFEALAEFGVTRFMALFPVDSDVEMIGPVRSARPYFVEWAMGFHPIYAHAGGSPQAVAMAEQTDELVNLDEEHLDTDEISYFWRSRDRVAPHNLYTSSAELARYAADRGKTALEDADIGFVFKTDASESQRPAEQRLDYFFLHADDPAGWIYDPATNGYLRLRRGRAARDLVSGEQLWTKNVVVMEVPEEPIAGDEKGRISQTVIGTGRARVFVDGREREVEWRKPSASMQLGFFDDAGDEIEFNAGPVWIAAVPSLENLRVR